MEREEQGSQVERKDQWEEMEWFAPYDEAQDRDQGVEEDEEPPTPSPIYDAPPSLPLPYLAICPAKPPSPATTTRGSSVETVVEDTQEAAFGSLQPRDEDEDDESADYSILDPSEPQTYTATELMLSLQHGTSFTSINTQETSASSRSNSTRSSLLPHKHDSPFSANHPLTTTLAPATSVSSLSLPAVLEPLLSSSLLPKLRLLNNPIPNRIRSPFLLKLLSRHYHHLRLYHSLINQSVRSKKDNNGWKKRIERGTSKVHLNLSKRSVNVKERVRLDRSVVTFTAATTTLDSYRYYLSIAFPPSSKRIQR